MLSKYEDTQKFYFDHPELVCEETANQLVVWCIDLAVEEACDAMDLLGFRQRVARRRTCF